jgi:hypothetical protein
MKKIELLAIAVLLVSALSLSCQKESDENKSEAGRVEKIISEKIQETDEATCAKARKNNSRAAWEAYLREFPNGKCAAEGKAVRNKYKRIGTYEWSDVIDSWTVSCEGVEEDGHTDWREPNIDELRTLVQNHPGTVAGGTCKICEKDSLGFGREFDEIDYEETINFKNCEGIEGDNFSKLGDKGWLESRSVSGVKYFCGDKGETLYAISFDDGENRRFYFVW